MTDLPMPARQAGRHRELPRLIALATPLAATQIAQMLMGITDAVMIGRISSVALAAGGLGSNVAFLLVLIAQGLLVSVQPLIAQARGAEAYAGETDRPAESSAAVARRALWGGFFAAFLLTVPIMVVLGSIDHLLIAAGEPAEVARLTGHYERAFFFGVPAILTTTVLRLYLGAIERTHVAMVIAWASCGLNIVLNWVFIFGHLGFPALGICGSGFATATTAWCMALAYVLVIGYSGLLPKHFWRVDTTEIRRGFRAVVRLGWPIAGIYAMEIGLFSVSSLLMGAFGPVALAAHQICLNLVSLVFMVPSALAQAATVRVGFHRGGGSMARARHAGFLALVTGGIFMVAMSAVVALGNRVVFGLYLDESDPNYGAVIALGTRLLSVACLFQVFDGVQAVAAGALRGLKDMRVPLLAGGIGYWGLGVPVGVALAFRIGIGPMGLWWGFVSGLTVAAVLLTLRFVLLTRRLLRFECQERACANAA